MIILVCLLVIFAAFIVSLNCAKISVFWLQGLVFVEPYVIILVGLLELFAAVIVD